MKKRIVMAMILPLVMAWGLGPALAADQARTLQRGAQRLQELVGGGEGDNLQNGVAEFKKAGLSYQPSLAIPTEGLVRCKSPEQLRLLYGAYAFDANYALLFGKKHEFGIINHVMQREMLDALKLRGKVSLTTLDKRQLQRIADDPGGPASREIMIRNVTTNVEQWIKAAQGDPEIMTLLVDGLYGSVIQGLYVACRLAQAAGPGDQLVALFNEQARRVDKANLALDAFAGDQQWAEAVKVGPRQAVLKPIVELLQTKKGRLSDADVRQVLALVEPERAPLVKRCP